MIRRTADRLAERLAFSVLKLYVSDYLSFQITHTKQQ